MRAIVAVLGLVALVVPSCGGSAQPSSSGDAGIASADAASSSGDAAAAPERPRSIDALQACSAPGTCELGATGCCGLTCQSDAQLVAIRRGEAQAVIVETCTDPSVPCPKCVRQLDANIQAFCESGRCTVVDIRTHALAACETADDCVLYYASCCQPCSGESERVVAVRKDAQEELAQQLCTGAEACPKCVPALPADLQATCHPTTRQCQVAGR